MKKTNDTYITILLVLLSIVSLVLTMIAVGFQLLTLCYFSALCCVIFFLGAYYYNRYLRYYKRPQELAQQKQYASQYYVHDKKKESTIILKKRDPAIRNYIKINKHVTANVQYKPETLHYGSATVGGVTSGGFYTTGGYHEFKGSNDEGKYDLTTFDGIDISRIQLDDDLYEEAKKSSSISEYLNDEKQIEVRRKLTKLEMDFITTTFANQGQLLHLDVPDYDKAINILKWISNQS